ncbi:MAG: 2-polyprenylphenol 6-hydroxylase [Alphaproteobacteria bacterium]|nr:2-polyprenylphenol 6-hydroxylase [Alphaproteobacteria bacterium]
MTMVIAYLRLARAAWVMAREGVIASLPSDGLRGPALFAYRVAGWLARGSLQTADRASRLTRAVERLGPSYVKLCQFLATRPDVVGRALAHDLSLLQDRMDTFATAEAKQRIADSIGIPVETLYSRFDDAIAAASIAQVHPAEITNAQGTRKVAVKVVRPGIRGRFYRDLDSFFLIAEMAEKLVPASRRLRPVEIARTLEQTTKIEMDMRLEAAALSELAENTQDDPSFRVPAVDWERTGRDVVTMAWVDGIKISELEALKAAGHDPVRLSEVLIQSFLRHTLRDGFFHADMHQGNLFVDASGCIVAVDMGIVGRLGKKERRFLAEILYGFIKRDYRRVAEVHFEAGYVPAHHDVASFAQAIRAIGEPIHGQSAETISMAKLLTLLFEVTELFDMETRPELIMLQKTMVVVEGVSRLLNPNFNMWKAAEPVVGDWIARNLGPARVVTDLKDGLTAAARLAEQAPQLAARAERLSREIDEMSTSGLRFDAETAESIGKAEARHSRSGRIALWVIALTAIYIAFQL